LSILPINKIGIKPHTLRYWEKEFSDFLKPYRSKGGHRRYREDDLKTLLEIKHLLKNKKYTIKGAREILSNGEIKNKKEKSSHQGKFFHKKKILITGGTGTVGKEITRRNVENIRYFVGDVRDAKRLEMAMEEIDIVFHLAALKHVTSCEYNPFEAINTNVYGSQNVINAALKINAEKVIFTSTDKAVNPTSTMGATKLMAEKLFTAANYYKGKRRTIFASVRFGNVLGSRGSAIPLFKNQFLNGKQVTLTSKKMTRFIMSLREAVDFIFKATLLARGGEVFVPKMPAIRIIDLVEAIGESLGFNNNIKEIGVKPGEKLYEELMTRDEERRSLERDDMYIILTSEKGEFLSKTEIREFLQKESLI